MDVEELGISFPKTEIDVIFATFPLLSNVLETINDPHWYLISHRDNGG